MDHLPWPPNPRLSTAIALMCMPWDVLNWVIHGYGVMFLMRIGKRWLKTITLDYQCALFDSYWVMYSQGSMCDMTCPPPTRFLGPKRWIQNYLSPSLAWSPPSVPTSILDTLHKVVHGVRMYTMYAYQPTVLISSPLSWHQFWNCDLHSGWDPSQCIYDCHHEAFKLATCPAGLSLDFLWGQL